jgi:protein-disulfide isomerase
MEETQNNNQEVSSTSADKSANIPVSKPANLSMPWAVVIAGVVIAIAILVSNTSTKGNTNIKTGNKLNVKDISEVRSIEPVTNKDRIKGNLDTAKVAIVEFSDLECPYCQRIHPILNEIRNNYTNDVVWVYRHFPLESIHPRARPAAHASECVLELGDNDMFWKFIDTIFAPEADSSILAEASLANVVTSLGIDSAQFTSCQNSGKHNELINAHIVDSQAAGAKGTPDVTVINLKTGEAVHTGADPSSIVKIIDQMLGQ